VEADIFCDSLLDKVESKPPRWLVADSERIPPLDHGARRQIRISWGLGVMLLGLAAFVSGSFLPFLLVGSGILIVLWGHFPNLFAQQQEAQLVADVPYHRKESLWKWAAAVVLVLVFSGLASFLFKRFSPQKPDISKLVRDAVLDALRQNKSASPPAPSANPGPLVEPGSGHPESIETAIAKLTELGWAVNPHDPNHNAPTQSVPGSPVPEFTLSRNVPDPPPFEKSAPYLRLINQPFMISIGGMESLDELAYLRDIANLRYLRIYNGSTRDLAGVGQLKSITTLEIQSVTGFSNLSPISNLTRLEYLTLTGCAGIRDISPLAVLKHLKALRIDDTYVSDISPLRANKSLNLLSLTQTQVTDLSPLRDLPALQEIGIYREQLPGIVSLAQLHSLKILSVGLFNPPVGASVDITPLSSMVNLSELDIVTSDAVQDIEPLRSLLNLSKLTIDELRSPRNALRIENIENISSIGSLTRLKCLSLIGIELPDITFLSTLKVLTDINLSSAYGLVNIQTLGTLPELRRIDIPGALVVDISPLLNLRALKLLNIRGVPARADTVTQLEDRGVIILRK
jgi:Leucine-rich repeat (LRR) protein